MNNDISLINFKNNDVSQGGGAIILETGNIESSIPFHFCLVAAQSVEVKT